MKERVALNSNAHTFSHCIHNIRRAHYVISNLLYIQNQKKKKSGTTTTTATTRTVPKQGLKIDLRDAVPSGKRLIIWN